MPAPRYTPAPPVQIQHPEWARAATLYQINTRQFTPEGTLNAARAHLPRLRDFGADILWLMPIHPIGEQNRKGTLGSPYAVRDYRAVMRSATGQQPSIEQEEMAQEWGLSFSLFT